MSSFSFGSLVVIILLFAGVAGAQTAPPGLRIEGVSYKGSGCPTGTVRWAIAPDSSAISFLFDQYVLQGARTQIVRDCQVRFLMMFPKNYRLRIVGVDYRGAFALPEGSTAQMYNQIMQTISKSARVIDENTETFRGPGMDSVTISRSTTKGDVFKCNGIAGLSYVFKSQLRLHNPTDEEALIQVDSTDIDVKGGVSFRLAWEKC